MIELTAPSLRAQFQGPAAVLLEFLEDPAVTDIFINGTSSLYVEKNGLTMRQGTPFTSASQLMELIERLVLPLAKRVDALRPYLDGALADGSRFHLMLPPLVDPGPAISIRKFSAAVATDLFEFGTPEQIAALTSWVKERKNILLCGATGAGKTTLLGKLLDQVASEERVLIIEECPEIQVVRAHQIRLIARPATPDGKGLVTLSELVRNSLRMRPDRIIVGECRGREALDFLQAMSTGHTGCMGTLHARGTRDALSRLEVLVSLANAGLERSAIKQWISGAIDGVVYLERSAGAARRQIVEMSEIKGWEGEHFRLLPIPLETSADSGRFLR